MKTAIRLFATAAIITLMTSCVVPQRGYQQPTSGRPYQKNDPYGLEKGLQRHQITGYKKTPYTIRQRAYIEVAGDAPQGVTDAVRAGLEDYAEELFHSKGEWPSRGQLSGVARNLYARQGYSLAPSGFGQPGGFAITKYQPGLK